jgi:serine/threonine protein kinase
MYIVMELLQGNDLFKWLDKRNFKLTEEKARAVAYKIACALLFMHHYGIIHRDIKPENILMTDTTDDADLKIVDFGLSKMLGPG